MSRTDHGPTRRDVAIAGHAGDAATAVAGLASDDPAVRATALGALARLGALADEALAAALADRDPGVRRRAATLAAGQHGVALLAALADPDPLVAEAAAWALGERQAVDHTELAALIDLAGSADDLLVREAAVAALGAIGDDAGLDAVLTATTDKPAIRRRAVIALAAFLDPDGPRIDEVRAAITTALDDRDWQVRQAAEDLVAVLDTAFDEGPDGPDDEPSAQSG